MSDYDIQELKRRVTDLEQSRDFYRALVAFLIENVPGAKESAGEASRLIGSLHDKESREIAIVAAQAAQRRAQNRAVRERREQEQKPD